jgi:flagellar L-ring protein precursor FlgH
MKKKRVIRLVAQGALVCMLAQAVLVCMLARTASAGLFPSKDKTKVKAPELSPLDRYIASASATPAKEAAGSPGAIWTPAARLNDLARDLRASQVDDVVTIVVTETVNAAASGASTTERASSANSSITALAGAKSPTGALANLAGLTGDQKLNGTGTTTRAATLNATLTARVVSVMPGGLLLIEGAKDLQINSEQQLITVRGIIRTADITTTNTVASTQIADVEIRLNGKGVVGDAVRRPNALYRFVLGLLPF